MVTHFPAHFQHNEILILWSNFLKQHGVSSIQVFWSPSLIFCNPLEEAMGINQMARKIFVIFLKIYLMSLTKPHFEGLLNSQNTKLLIYFLLNRSVLPISLKKNESTLLIDFLSFHFNSSQQQESWQHQCSWIADMHFSGVSNPLFQFCKQYMCC